MTLLTFNEVSLEFGALKLLTDVDFAIAAGERVCLIGRNGAGKSSLLKLITGELQPDHGEVRRKSDLRLSQLTQDLPVALDYTVAAYVTTGLAELAALIALFRERSQAPLDQAGLQTLETLQQRIEAHGGWNIEQRVASLLSELNLPGEARLAHLSGGWRRRVALAQALVSEPDLLLLDEPTNHLDLSTILWLENRVHALSGSVLFITHDRAFVRRLATRIVELDRGRLTSWPGDYDAYLANKDKALEDEARQDALFDKRLQQEEAWIREGIKARRTRNEGRVRALEAMRATVAERWQPLAKARIHVEEAAQSGRKIVEARNILHGFGGEPLIKGFSIKMLRGDRIGLIGNNGVGKSTLLKILLGEITPDAGSVKRGTHLEIGYFDQLRRELDPEKTVAEIVGDGREYLKIGGHDRHVIGYLRGFLFSAERAQMPVKALSGGECNRVILARLFTRPTNLLILDEPTNDLDVETLDVLEDRLAEYGGSLIVVTHDREFLDNVVTSILVFEDGGRIQRYAGGYKDWLTRGIALAEKDAPARSRQAAAAAAAPPVPRQLATKLSYKLKLELERLPGRIAALEARIAELGAETHAEDFYRRPYVETQAALHRLNEQQQALADLMARWMELETLQERLQLPGA